ncbi:hypothetical protein ABT390_34730 [Streptomyces aurantiacus]|uniref:hypothetical protein n=1 Tax=Streptomyces aurantiacus TaxID=47760 RepID=UPI00040216B5|nr:hypothetical protein [Streptomyces aurantiacus]
MVSMLLRALSLLILGTTLFVAVTFAIEWSDFVGGGWVGWLIGSLIGIVGVKFAWETWLKGESEAWLQGFWKEVAETSEERVHAGGAASAEPVVKVTFPASSDDAGGCYWDGSMALFHHSDGASSAVDISGGCFMDRLAVLSHVHPPEPDKTLTVTPGDTWVSDSRNQVGEE